MTAEQLGPAGEFFEAGREERIDPEAAAMAQAAFTRDLHDSMLRLTTRTEPLEVYTAPEVE